MRRFSLRYFANDESFRSLEHQIQEVAQAIVGILGKYNIFRKHQMQQNTTEE